MTFSDWPISTMPMHIPAPNLDYTKCHDAVHRLPCCANTGLPGAL